MKRRDGKLKILFVTSGDPFFGRHFFAEFFRLFYKNKIDILGVIIQEPLGTSKIGAVKKTYGLYGFFGTIKLSILAFYLSIRGLIPKFVYKGRGGNYTLKQILSSEKIRIIGMGNINDDVSIRILKSLAPDIIISMSASQKFGAEVLSVPRVACLNVHSGELPRYRGMSTVFWMLYEGKGYTSPTIHIMNEKLDDGPIVASERCDIADNDTLYTATVKTKYCAARLLVDVLSHYSESNVKLKPNDKGEAKIYRFPGKKAAKEFKKRGRRLI